MCFAGEKLFGTEIEGRNNHTAGSLRKDEYVFIGIGAENLVTRCTLGNW